MKNKCTCSDPDCSARAEAEWPKDGDSIVEMLSEASFKNAVNTAGKTGYRTGYMRGYRQALTVVVETLQGVLDETAGGGLE